MTLAIQHISFERNHRALFHCLTGDIQPGECLQITGHNGSGKSTLLRVLAGLLEPLNGEILWQTTSIFKEREIYHQQLHYLGHQNSIKRSLTVYENLTLSTAIANVSLHKTTIQHVLQRLHLSHALQTPAAHLSAGQLRRLSLSRLLLYPKPLWILDEPSTALDAKGQQILSELLNQHLATKGLAIIATHQTLELQHPIKIMQIGHHDE